MRNWIYSKAQNDDLILCSKLSLARNLEGVLFTDKLEVEDAKKNVDKYQENYERMESRLKTDNASHDKITKQYEDAQAKLDKIQQEIDALNKK